jgi:hypothetical protein
MAQTVPDRAVSQRPLIAAFIAGQAAGQAHGAAHAYASAISYLALAIWAYEELVHGVNWFRHGS